ncbi:hypothetical protein QN277_024702 [Acacia crassicarpa]|uniref:Uncharacterized protein n=1 Tax=Acacia crassicarpa TaxID=499986 RepID=A0AAE1JED1_9FABA|nr:hypothetical protein QN277_024702 [Acacia crassicarpa]
MYSPMLVNCSNCRTPLQLPPGVPSLRCALCHAVTHIADPRAVPPQPPSSVVPSPNWNAPSPYYGAPPGPPLNAHGRKKAVIVSILYRDSRHELKGFINNAKCMRHLLVNKFKFPESSILMLTEEETDPYRIPTKYNMRMAMFWLVQGCQPGDSLVFHYSGHGSQQRDNDGDEVDGYDETLCPLDFETQGVIVDDEINSTLVRPLPHGAKLHALIDASHSGTMLDLPYLCKMKRNDQCVWEDHCRRGVWKGSNGGEVISFSACDDRQTCADTSALSKITSTGAMTFFFIQAIEHGHGATYFSILKSMRAAIRNVGKKGGSGGAGVVETLGSMLLNGGVHVAANLATILLTGGIDIGGVGDDVEKFLVSKLLTGGADVVAKLVSMLLTGGIGGGLRQEPQLTACQTFDVHAKPFSF